MTDSRTLFAGESDAAGAVIEGIVTNAEGDPLGGVIIRALVWTGEQPVTESTPDGRFRLELEAATARYSTLIANSSDGELSGFHQLTQLDPSGSVVPVEILMKPPLTIDVIVRDAEGQPVDDAAVEVSSSFRPVASGITDGSGRWRGQVPLDAPIAHVVALKDGIGFDYYQNGRRYEGEPNTDVPEEFLLNLDGAVEVEVFAATDDGDPVPGVELQPWYIQKPDRADDVNLSGSGIVKRTTDEQGIAVFRWFPSRFERGIPILIRSDEWHAPTWPNLLAGAVERRLTYRLRRMVPISGSVVDADGQPAAGIRVSIAGQGGNDRDDHRSTVATDADGRYEALVPPQLTYIIAVEDDEWTSENLMDVPVYQNEPRDGLDLTLFRGTLVHGSVRQSDGTPLSGQSVTLRLDGRQTPFKPDDDSNAWRAPTLYRRAVTGEDGTYELRVGPGAYNAWGPDSRNRSEVTIVDQPELPLDFEVDVPTRQPLTGRVVRAGAEDVTIPDVVVSGVQIEPEEYADIATETDAEGRFATDRFPSRMLLHALSSDGALGATREIQPDTTEVDIAVSPTSSAVGRVVDDEGQPTAGFRFRYAIEVKYPNGTMTSRFGGTAVTDDDGQFQLENLIVNQEYECRHQHKNSYFLLTNVTAIDEELIDLGTITYPRGQRDRTYVEWARGAFARSDDPAAAVETAVNVAALDGRRVLLLEGAADDADVRSLFRVFDDDTRTWDRSRDPLIRNLAHYIVVGVSRGDADGNRLFIIDQDRSAVAEATLQSLTDESGEVDATLLTQFLEAHLSASVDAERRLADAMEAAADSGKPILVVQTEPHDSQSERMLEFVVEVRPLLERHFILFPVDERMSRGRELTNALRESLTERYVDPRQRRVPWTAVIDASGTRLAVAEINENTVGFPRIPEEIDVFLRTLREGAPGVSDADLKALREALVPGRSATGD